MKKTAMTRRNVYLPDDLWQKLEAIREKTGYSVSVQIRNIIQQHLEK